MSKPDSNPSQPSRADSSGSADRDSAAKPVKPAPAKNLSPEEQLAQYEEDLKDTDWGHQPC